MDRRSSVSPLERPSSSASVESRKSSTPSSVLQRASDAFSHQSFLQAVVSSESISFPTGLSSPAYIPSIRSAESGLRIYNPLSKGYSAAEPVIPTQSFAQMPLRQAIEEHRRSISVQQNYSFSPGGLPASKLDISGYEPMPTSLEQAARILHVIS